MCTNPYFKKIYDENGILRSYQACSCGKCIECLKDYQNEWTFRLQQETKHSQSVFKFELTYDDESLLFDSKTKTAVVCRKHVQNFFKRLRKSIEPYKIRYFGISEYGGKTNRPHYHVIIWNLPCKNIFEADALVQRSWYYGHVRTRVLNFQGIRYVCKYLNKIDNRDHAVKPFRFMSTHPAIGSQYLTPEIIRFHLDNSAYYVVNQAYYKQKMPRYYRKKIFENVPYDNTKNDVLPPYLVRLDEDTCLLNINYVTKTLPKLNEQSLCIINQIRIKNLKR